MPDLERSTVLTWLAQNEPDKPDLRSPAVTPIEDDPRVEDALARLGQVLDAAASKNPVQIMDVLLQGPGRDEMRRLLGQIGTPRALRVIEWLLVGADLPNSDAVFGALVQEDPSGAGAFVRATIAASLGPPLLDRLYAPERLTLLLQACKTAPSIREAA